eukprot:5271707-Pyramimonas_sp.AAC.2
MRARNLAGYPAPSATHCAPVVWIMGVYIIQFVPLCTFEIRTLGSPIYTPRAPGNRNGLDTSWGSGGPTQPLSDSPDGYMQIRQACTLEPFHFYIKGHHVCDNNTLPRYKIVIAV